MKKEAEKAKKDAETAAKSEKKAEETTQHAIHQVSEAKKETESVK